MLPSSLHISILSEDAERVQQLRVAFEALGLASSCYTRETPATWVDQRQPVLVFVDLLDDPRRMAHIRIALEITGRFNKPVLLLSPCAADALPDAFQDDSDPFHYLHPNFSLRELRLSMELACLRNTLNRRVKDQVQLTRSVITHSGQALIQVDTGGLVAFMNAEAERLTGWMLQLARGRRLVEVFRSRDSREAGELERFIHEGGLMSTPTQWLYPYDGEPLQVQRELVAVAREDGGAIGYLLIFGAPAHGNLRNGGDKASVLNGLARTS